MDSPQASFRQSRAYVIGIDTYTQLPPLTSAANDAREVARILTEVHGYNSVDLLVDSQATLTALRRLLTERLPQDVQARDRVLIYFAGHGVALPGQDGPAGYIVPQDGSADDPTSLLAMQTLYQALAPLPCPHLLLILDCCFAGAFRWAIGQRKARPCARRSTGSNTAAIYGVPPGRSSPRRRPISRPAMCRSGPIHGAPISIRPLPPSCSPP